MAAGSLAILSCLAAAGGALLLAPAAGAQAPRQAAVSSPAAGAPAPPAADPAEDRIFALVQAGKCGQAKAAAEQANDPNLAGQIGLMCGARSSSPSGAGGGRRSGGRGGGGSGSGARSGGGR